MFGFPISRRVAVSLSFVGARTETCPPGMKTGDPISPKGVGYKGGGMQLMVDASIDPAGNVWMSNNWQVTIQATVLPMRGFRPAAGARAWLCFTVWPNLYVRRRLAQRASRRKLVFAIGGGTLETK